MRTIIERYGTFGWEEFLQNKEGILGEYDSVKAATKNRPTRTAHGPAVEAAVRSWLTEFLPKRFAVTSGYVVPDIRTTAYVIRHFDVIVYDQANAPVLWVETTQDQSQLGKRRAVPANFVHAVLEVKATLTKRAIGDALAKLEEANEFVGHLNPTFSSGIVFAEVKQGLQKRCSLAENLNRPDIVGYFGGIILRAEKLDPKLAGYFSLINTDRTEEHMPLVRDPGG